MYSQKTIIVIAGAACLAGSIVLAALLFKFDVRVSNESGREPSVARMTDEPHYEGKPLSYWEPMLYDRDAGTVMVGAASCKRMGRDGLRAILRALDNWYETTTPEKRSRIYDSNDPRDNDTARLLYLAEAAIAAVDYDSGLVYEKMVGSEHPGFRFLAYTALLDNEADSDVRRRIAETFLQDEAETNREHAAQELSVHYGWNSLQTREAIRSGRIPTPVPTPYPTAIPTPAPTPSPVPSPTPEPPRFDVLMLFDGTKVVGTITSEARASSFTIETDSYGTLTFQRSAVRAIARNVYATDVRTLDLYSKDYLVTPIPTPVRPIETIVAPVATPFPSPAPSPKPTPAPTPVPRAVIDVVRLRSGVTFEGRASRIRGGDYLRVIDRSGSDQVIDMRDVDTITTKTLEP